MSSKLLDGGSADPFPWFRISEAEPAHAAADEGARGQPASDEAPLAPYLARIAELEKEVVTLRAKAPDERRAGFAEGLARGEANGEEKWSAALQRVAKTLHDLAQCRPNLRREVESDAVRLALAIARKVLHRELQVDPEAILGLVRVAFEKVNARDVLRVRAAPADLPGIRDRMPGLPQRIEFVADPGLERGSVVLDTVHGQVDASAQTQLEEIERGLADALERNGP